MANDSLNGNSCHQCIPDDEWGDKKEEPVEIRNLITNLLGLICNGVALACMVRKKDCSRQFKVHMIAILVVDIQLNVTILALTGARARGELSPTLCVALLVPCLFSLLSNAGFVLALALDRLYAVFAPYKYRSQTRAEMTAGLRVGVAIVATIPTLLTIFVNGPQPGRQYCYPSDVSTPHGMVMMGCHIVLCSCVTIVIYVSLLCKVATWNRSKLHPTSGSDHKTGRFSEKTRNLTVWSAVFMTWFLMSYLPFGIYVVHLGSLEDLSRLMELGTSRFVVLTMSPFMNAVVDPFLVFCQLGSDTVRRLCRALPVPRHHKVFHVQSAV